MVKKGMRWGVRKKFVGPVQPTHVKIHNALPSQNTLNSTKGISDYSRTGVDAIRNTSSHVYRTKKGSAGREQSKTMSDAELKEKINRLNLEQQYANLSASNVSKGRVTVENSLAIAGGVLMVKQLTGN